MTTDRLPPEDKQKVQEIGEALKRSGVEMDGPPVNRPPPNDEPNGPRQKGRSLPERQR